MRCSCCSSSQAVSQKRGGDYPLSAGCHSYSATPTADAQAVVACRIFCARAQLYAEMKLIQWCPLGRTRPSLDASTRCPSLPQRFSYLGLLAFHLSAAPRPPACAAAYFVVIVCALSALFLLHSSHVLPFPSCTPSCSLAFYLGFLPMLQLLA